MKAFDHSVLCYSLLGGCLAHNNAKQLDKLVRKARLVFGTHSLETLKKAVERATGAKAQAIMNNLKYPTTSSKRRRAILAHFTAL